MKQKILPCQRIFFPAAQSGNILVLVLVLMLVGSTVAAMSLALVVNTTQSLGGKMETDRIGRAVEGGVENAILRLLRNPSYTGEEMVIDEVPITITVTQGAQTTIVATGVDGVHRQRLQVTLARINGVLTVQTWQRID